MDKCKICTEPLQEGVCIPCEDGSTNKFVLHLLDQHLGKMTKNMRDFVDKGQKKRGVYLSTTHGLLEAQKKELFPINFVEQESFENMKYDDGNNYVVTYDETKGFVIAATIIDGFKSWLLSRYVSFEQLNDYPYPLQESHERVCRHCGKASLKVCSKCMRIRYCSVECQEHDWKFHRQICKHLQTLPPPPTSPVSPSIPSSPPTSP